MTDARIGRPLEAEIVRAGDPLTVLVTPGELED
jgi:hypothetical protein